jgi:hypothetical protein
MAHNPELTKFEPCDFPLSNKAVEYQKSIKKQPFEKVVTVLGVGENQVLNLINKFLSPDRQYVNYFCQQFFDNCAVDETNWSYYY